MGMYTEIFFRAEVDERAYEVIRGIAERDVDPAALTSLGPFFGKPRAAQVFRGGSAYFPGARHFEARIETYGPSIARYISFRADLKNYDGEIQAFFDWVMPHVLTDGFVGYSLYEEADTPTLYCKNEDDQ